MTHSRSRPASHLEARRHEFGHAILGPIFFTYAHRLRLHLEGLRQQEPVGVALFCARGGLRLRLLFDRYCTALGVESPWPATDYFISRIAAVRACLAADFSTARTLLVQGLGDTTERQLLATLLAGSAVTADDFLPPATPHADAACDVGIVLDRLRAGTHPAADAVMTHAHGQHALLRSYTAAVLGDARAAAVCDTGLRCTAQIVLSRLFPETRWFGLLLGCLRRGIAADHYQDLYGLLFDIQLHRDQSRRSTFIRHWELFERVLEPALPTTSFYVPDPREPTRGSADACLQPRAADIDAGDPFFEGVLEYFETDGPATVASRAGRLASAYETALTRLDRALAFPTALDVETLNVVDHDLGFGLPRTITSTTRTASSLGLSGKMARVQASSWPHGQARLEFGPFAPAVQLLLYRPRLVIRAGEFLGRTVHAVRRRASQIAAAGVRAITWSSASKSTAPSAADLRP